MIFFTASIPGQRDVIIHRNISPSTQKKLFKSIGWNERQMNILLQTLTTMLEHFNKISGTACALKIEIDRYQENPVELSLSESQFNLTLTRNLDPEEVTLTVALGIGQQLSVYCFSHTVPGISKGIPIVSVLAGKESLLQISNWIFDQTLKLKILLTLLPNPPVVPNKFCQKRAAVSLEELRAQTKKIMVNDTDLLTSIAILAMFSVVEEKNGSNQIHTQFVQEFNGEMDQHLRLIDQALDRPSPDHENWFYHYYQVFKQHCNKAYNSMKISF
ncbi:MAG: hypothetical protein ABIH69_00985 [bacterium]|nr:hypothetical protein [Candidatus Margulisiibacteriota bacterium]